MESKLAVFQTVCYCFQTLILMQCVSVKPEPALGDEKLHKAAKIEKLIALRNESEAVQRAASESPMTGDDTIASDLKLIDQSLDKLGFVPVDKGPATL